MKNFLDKDGRQAKIEKGCSFIWDPNNTEMFSATPIMDGRSLLGGMETIKDLRDS